MAEVPNEASAVEQYVIDNMTAALTFLRSRKAGLVSAANANINIPFVGEGTEERLFGEAFEAVMDAAEDDLADVIRRIL